MFFSKIIGTTVPFITYKLKASRIIIYNPYELKEEIHEECSYLVSTNRTCDYLDHERGRLFYAERYGGSGILSHGGGSRCGVVDKFQVKGIGLNPVAGVTVEADYSTGRLRLINGVCEYFNARLIKSALPLGSVEHLAVIELPFEMANTCTNTFMKTALLIREPAIRPAHFERAIFFKPLIKEFYSLFEKDSDRVRHSLKILIDEITTPNRDIRDGINDFLKSFLENCARQMATAFGKRIHHGAISSSNIDIRGRWLDLETTTFLNWNDANPDNLRNLELEHRHILETIKHLTFYIEKYVMHNPNPHRTNVEELSTYFLRQFENYLLITCLARAGFPIIFLSRTAFSTERDLLANELYKLHLHALKSLEHYKTSAIKSDPFYDILTSLTSNNNDTSYEKILLRHGINGSTGMALKQKFDDFKSKLSIEIQAHGCSPTALENWLKITVCRFAIGLNFENAHDHIMEWSSTISNNPSTDKTDSLLRELYSSWCDTCDNSFSHSENNLTICWTSGESTLEYDILDDLYIFSTPENTLKIPVLSDIKSRTLTNFLKKLPPPLKAAILDTNQPSI
jgi:hypothetical protein